MLFYNYDACAFGMLGGVGWGEVRAAVAMVIVLISLVIPPTQSHGIKI